MQIEQIHAVAIARGVTPQALGAVTAKVQAHFGDRNPPPPELEAYIANCPVWEKLGMDQATFDGMPAAWRLEQAEAYRPLPVQRRPQYRLATDAERAAWQEQGLNLAETLTAYRAQCKQDQG
jgi:hypothetical protein